MKTFGDPTIKSMTFQWRVLLATNPKRLVNLGTSDPADATILSTVPKYVRGHLFWLLHKEKWEKIPERNKKMYCRDCGGTITNLNESRCGQAEEGHPKTSGGNIARSNGVLTALANK